MWRGRRALGRIDVGVCHEHVVLGLCDGARDGEGERVGGRGGGGGLQQRHGRL